MRLETRKKAQLILLLKAILERTIVIVLFGISILRLTNQKIIANGHPRKYTIIDRIPSQIQNMADLLHVNDEDCRNKLQMDRTSFYRLCSILQHVGGLKPSKYVNVFEKVAMFLIILAHHSKNRCVKFQFKRSGQTVSKIFHSVLRSVLKLHNLLLVKPHSVLMIATTLARINLRSWSRVEEDALIHCLTDIVNDGWKAENGFKAGFLQELEKGMRKTLPCTDIVANPHINSKIHVWKKAYSALTDLMSKSGIRWNSTTSMIDVKDEGVWDACRRVDPQVKGIRYKTWPYYSHWLEIFGKDRATGENALDPNDLVNDLNRSIGQEQVGDIEEDCAPIPPIEVNEAEMNSVCKPTRVGKKQLSKGIKRKNIDVEVNSLVDTLGEFMKQSQETFGDIAKGLGTSAEKNIDNKHLNEIMNRIVGLKVADKLKVCDELVQNTNRLDFFMCLPPEEQDEYVWMLLDGRL
ncbi:hypothetical protein ACS0TY_002215 [Phlomoides rotata]